MQFVYRYQPLNWFFINPIVGLIMYVVMQVTCGIVTELFIRNCDHSMCHNLKTES